MVKLNINCPICGHKMKNQICNNCGYLLLLFPNEIPQKIQDFEDTRVRIMKLCFRKNQKPVTSNAPLSPQPAASPVDKKRIIGSLIIRNLMTESHIIKPIYDGRNIYGGSESDKADYLHINPIELGVDIPSIIFALEPSPEGLRLLPYKGFPLSHNRCLIDRIMVVENDDYFFYSNTLSFNAVLFDQ